MAEGGALYSATLLHRLAIGRALTRKGDPVRAEHYLQWTDARFVDPRAASLQYAFGPYNSYQRVLAFEAANERRHGPLPRGRR